jgi:hydrogenase expression/formation protein HypE
MEQRPDRLPVGKLPAELLGRLLATYATRDSAVVVGPGVGGDAAAIRVGGTTLVVKSDPITFASESPASYLVDVNANDLACLGATGRWMMVTALLPEKETTEAAVEAHIRELRDACSDRGIALVGGHTEITAGLERAILVGVLLGEVGASGLLAPGGGRPGDRLLLSKGIAIEGTALLAREAASGRLGALEPGLLERAADLLADPGISVVAEATAFLDAGGVTALHDPTEGGLATGVHELALACGCGAVIERNAIPVLPETELIAAAFGLDPLGMLASGSLLAAAGPAAVDGLVEAGARISVPVTCIGELTDRADELVLRTAAGDEPLPSFQSDETTRALAREAGLHRRTATEAPSGARRRP